MTCDICKIKIEKGDEVLYGGWTLCGHVDCEIRADERDRENHDENDLEDWRLLREMGQ